MAYIRIKPIWTPMQLFGVKFYKDVDTKLWYVKWAKGAQIQRLRKA